MSDLRMNTVLGTGLAALLLVMGLRIAGEDVFKSPAPAKPGYAVDISSVMSSAGGGPKQEEGPVDWGAVLKDPALVAQGEKVGGKCLSCHNFAKGGPNMTGPNLYGVVDRPAASHPGFNYSAALKAYGKPWTYEALNTWLASPQKDVPGTLMTFVGLRGQADRNAMIAYLRSLSDSPAPLPPPLPPKSAPASTAPSSGPPVSATNPQSQGSPPKATEAPKP